MYNQFTGGTLPFDFTKNYKFTILNNENVWAKAMNRVVSEKVPVEKAVDELIARLKAGRGLTTIDAGRLDAAGSLSGARMATMTLDRRTTRPRAGRRRRG